MVEECNHPKNVDTSQPIYFNLESPLEPSVERVIFLQLNLLRTSFFIDLLLSRTPHTPHTQHQSTQNNTRDDEIQLISKMSVKNCTCCCGRWILLYNIEEATLDDIKSYLKGLFRLYCILFILNVLNTSSISPESNCDGFIFSAVESFLYLGNTVALWFVSDKPTNINSIYAMSVAASLSICNVVNTITVGVLDRNPYAAVYVVSISIQVTTIYILHKMREKLLDGENNILDKPILPVTANTNNPLTIDIDM
jgi:hypothetical protein